jgi:FMN phosphatase YigB (HAD superfamily)
LSNSVQRRDPREADAHDPAPHSEYGDQDHIHRDHEYGNEECEDASGAHEPEDQQAFEMRVVDEYWEYKDAGRPVPREIQETLDRLGIVIDD